MDIRVNYDEALPVDGDVFYRPHTVTLLMDRKPPMLVLTARTPAGEEVSLLIPAQEAIEATASMLTILSADFHADDDDDGPPPLHVA